MHLRPKELGFQQLSDQFPDVEAKLGPVSVARKFILVPYQRAKFRYYTKNGNVRYRYYPYQTKEELKELIRENKEKGMKYITSMPAFTFKPVDEMVYVVDEKNRVIYSNDDSIKNRTCYVYPGNGKHTDIICIPNNTTETPPSEVSEKPLKRDINEEVLIAMEEDTGDDVSLAHFAYYCRSRGGLPLLFNTDDGGIAVGCVGGKANKLYVKLPEESGYLKVLLDRMGPEEANRGNILYQYGKDHAKVYGKTIAVVPVKLANRLGLQFEST